MSAKYYILLANEQHSNYLLYAVVLTVGSYKNGATDASINPTKSGEGFGQFDLVTNLGGIPPTGATATINPTITSNTAAQYHVGKDLWPELEVNSTVWYGGKHDGKVETLHAPGIVASKFSLRRHETQSRSVWPLASVSRLRSPAIRSIITVRFSRAAFSSKMSRNEVWRSK